MSIARKMRSSLPGGRFKGFFLAFFWASSAFAGSHFDIPAQPLAGALKALEAQGGVSLVFTPETVGGAEGRAVRGEMSIEAALQQLLAGSGLKFEREGNRYVVLRAAQTPAKERALTPLTVTATRTERQITDVPASVSVISAKEIAQQQPRMVSDLLRNVEGIDFSPTASLGLTETVTMRGIPGPGTQLLIDGMPSNSPVAEIWFGIKGINAFDLEQVDVVRGPASALYGAGAMGGVINFIPKRWKGAPGAEVELGAGSHNATQVSVAVGAASEVADFRLSAIDYRTDGYIAQTELVWGGKDLGPRDGKQQSFSLTANLRPAEGHEFTLGVRHADTSSPWLGGHPNYRLDPEVKGYDLGYRYEAGDWGVFKARYRWLKQGVHRTFDDESANGNAGSLILAEEDHLIDQSQTLDVQADLKLIANNTLSLGVTHAHGEDSQAWRNVLDDTTGKLVRKGRATSLFIQDEHQFTPAFSVLVGGRWDRFEREPDTRNGVPIGENATDSVFNPRLGLRYKLGEATSFYASAGTAFIPARNFFRNGAPPNFIGDKGIKPETSTSYEIGLNHRTSYVSVRAALFHTDYTDRIVLVQVGAAPWPKRFINIGRVEVDGIELGVEGDLPGGWKPYANYAYTDSRIKKNPADPLSEGKLNPWMAPHKFNFGLSYSPSDTWYARFSGRYTSALYFDPRNTPAARNPSYFVADIKAGYQFPGFGFVKKPALSFAINNLFDRRYSEWRYEQMDRRNFWIGFSAQFN